MHMPNLTHPHVCMRLRMHACSPGFGETGLLKMAPGTVMGIHRHLDGNETQVGWPTSGLLDCLIGWLRTVLRPGTTGCQRDTAPLRRPLRARVRASSARRMWRARLRGLRVGGRAGTSGARREEEREGVS